MLLPSGTILFGLAIYIHIHKNIIYTYMCSVQCMLCRYACVYMWVYLYTYVSVRLCRVIFFHDILLRSGAHTGAECHKKLPEVDFENSSLYDPHAPVCPKV